MTNRTAATRYARALLDVALTERADVNAIDAQLAATADLFNQHETLRKVLLMPSVPVPRKAALMTELLDKMAVLPLVKKTLLLLVENDRLVLIPDVAEAFRQRLLDMRNVVRADVTTADALPPERLAAIQGSLAAATGRTVELTSRVDPSIVGGMVARIGSTVYDASIVNHLKRIRQRLDASI